MVIGIISGSGAQASDSTSVIWYRIEDTPTIFSALPNDIVPYIINNSDTKTRLSLRSSCKALSQLLIFQCTKTVVINLMSTEDYTGIPSSKRLVDDKSALICSLLQENKLLTEGVTFCNQNIDGFKLFFNLLKSNRTLRTLNLWNSQYWC